jgi:phenylpyruvate tautomerase PptA (4-oxalocrotonate tautomerase family)
MRKPIRATEKPTKKPSICWAFLMLLDGAGDAAISAPSVGGVGFAYVLFTPVGHGDWWIGGRTDATHVHAPGKFLARVSVPEGYMSQLHKSAVHRQVNDAIVAVVGDSAAPHAGESILVIIEEVTEGNWGCGGKTISLVSIAESVGLSKTGDRFKWIVAYFAAKAKQFTSAGYPPDTGGLLPPVDQ